MDGARPNWPFTWREPMQTVQRCPKCGARLIVHAAEDRCPYCGYSKYKALPVRERESSGVDMSLRNQIEDAIGATDEYGRPAEHFVDYNPPREQNFERWLFAGMMAVFLYLTSEFSDFNHHTPNWRPLPAPEYALEFTLLFLVIPALFYLLTMYTTFLPLKPIAVIVGVCTALAGVALYFNPDLVYPCLGITTDWMALVVMGYLVVFGLWAANICWRDWQILRIK